MESLEFSVMLFNHKHTLSCLPIYTKANLHCDIFKSEIVKIDSLCFESLSQLLNQWLSFPYSFCFQVYSLKLNPLLVLMIVLMRTGVCCSMYLNWLADCPFQDREENKPRT